MDPETTQVIKQANSCSANTSHRPGHIYPLGDQSTDQIVGRRVLVWTASRDLIAWVMYINNGLSRLNPRNFLLNGHQGLISSLSSLV